LGRAEELTAVSQLLRDGSRVVSLIGPAGVGKSRIALALADKETDQGTGYVVVARLGGISEPLVAREEILQQMPGQPGLAGSPGEALWERCQGADVLLVLDDVEVAADFGTLLAEMTAGYPALRILATSLRPLQMPGEMVVRIRPFPSEPDCWDTASGAVSPGVAVFVQRALASDARFSLGPHNVEDVVRVCREVGGLPLAIELAASRIATVEPAVMARQLTERSGLGLLHDPALGDEHRHASMEGALGWSYDLLGVEAQLLLDQITVFEGPFDLEAAQAVVVPASDSAAEMLDRLSELVDLQLVDLWPEDPACPRFSLPRLVRSYAARRLADAGTEECTRSRHARHYQARCQRGLIAPDEMPDVLAAVDRATIDGHVDDGLHAIVAAMATQPATVGVTRTLQRRVDHLLAHLGDQPVAPVLLARALIWSAAAVPDQLAGTTYAEWTAERVRGAVAAARRSGDRRAVLESLLLTVRALPTTLDAPSALAAAAEGLVLAHAVGDPHMIARFELYAAMTAQVRGDVDAMSQLALSAWRGAHKAADRQTEVRAALMLHRAQADLVGDTWALPSPRDLLTTCEELGDARLGGQVLATLADAALADGHVREATRWAYRLILVAADWRLTEPLLGILPLVTLVTVAQERGDLGIGIQLQSSIDRFGSAVAFSVPPQTLTRYHAATAGLLNRASPADRAAWTATGSSWDLPQASTQGGSYARSVLADDPVTRPVARPVAKSGFGPSPLTPREREVLVAIASGATNNEVARNLGVSGKTVMHHSVAIYRKLGVRGRGEATAWAFRSGLLDPPPSHHEPEQG